MKYILGVAIAVVVGLVVLFLVSVRTTEAPVQDDIEFEDFGVARVGSYALVPDASIIEWRAGKPLIVDYEHVGTIQVQKGSLIIDTDGIYGEVVMDMTQLKVTSLAGGKVGGESTLETHLKSVDFFNTDQYPTAEFYITHAVKSEVPHEYTLTGLLTMKGNTHEVSFIAQVFERGGEVFLIGQLEIDRTTWDITYGSATFFDNLVDGAIDDMVSLSLELTAVQDV